MAPPTEPAAGAGESPYSEGRPEDDVPQYTHGPDGGLNYTEGPVDGEGDLSYEDVGAEEEEGGYE